MVCLLLKFLIYFFPVIIFKKCIVKYYIVFGTQTLLDKSSKVLQLLTHLSNLAANK